MIPFDQVMFLVAKNQGPAATSSSLY